MMHARYERAKRKYRRAYVFHNKGSNDMVWRFEIYISRGGKHRIESSDIREG